MKGTEWHTGASPMRLTKEKTDHSVEWFWADNTDTRLSPRFSTTQEAGYWLVQFMGDEDEANKAVEGVEARPRIV